MAPTLKKADANAGTRKRPRAFKTPIARAAKLTRNTKGNITRVRATVSSLLVNDP